MTDSHSGSVAFASLGLHPKVMAGIRQAGFTQCTPIQAQTLPIALAGRDVAGQAQTGTGKTAAFLVALYQALLTRPATANRSPTSIRALIVAPTASSRGGATTMPPLSAATPDSNTRWCSAASTTRSSAWNSARGAMC